MSLAPGRAGAVAGRPACQRCRSRWVCCCRSTRIDPPPRFGAPDVLQSCSSGAWLASLRWTRPSQARAEWRAGRVGRPQLRLRATNSGVEAERRELWASTGGISLKAERPATEAAHEELECRRASAALRSLVSASSFFPPCRPATCSFQLAMLASTSSVSQWAPSGPVAPVAGCTSRLATPLAGPRRAAATGQRRRQLCRPTQALGQGAHVSQGVWAGPAAHLPISPDFCDCLKPAWIRRLRAGPLAQAANRRPFGLPAVPRAP